MKVPLVISDLFTMKVLLASNIFLSEGGVGFDAESLNSHDNHVVAVQVVELWRNFAAS